MADHEIERERIVEREVPVRGRRVVVERGGGVGPGFNPMMPIIAVLVVVLLLFLLLGGVR
jgi:hypothetical protein